MDNKAKLAAKVKRISKGIKKGDTLEFIYNGQCVD